MSQPFIGQIIAFAGNFAPRGWFLCQGQTLAIAQYTALFSILGTTYGGNGVTTFQLPDLRGRVAVSSGQGPGLSDYVLGEQTGTENVTLLQTQIPAHTHLVNGNAANGNSASPKDAIFGQTGVPRSSTTYDTYTTGAAGAPVTMAPNTIQNTGGNQPHSNVQPVLAIHYRIAYTGTFPSRN